MRRFIISISVLLTFPTIAVSSNSSENILSEVEKFAIDSDNKTSEKFSKKKTASSIELNAKPDNQIEYMLNYTEYLVDNKQYLKALHQLDLI